MKKHRIAGALCIVAGVCFVIAATVRLMSGAGSALIPICIAAGFFTATVILLEK